MPSERARLAADEFNRYAERVGAPGRCDSTLSFEALELNQVVAVWRNLAPASLMPSRQSVTAHTLRAFLPQVVLLDIVEDDATPKFRFRLMGTTISRILGDHTGILLEDAIVAPYCDRWNTAIRAAVNAEQPLRMVGRVDHGDHHLSIEFFVAPMSEPQSRPDAVLIVAHASSSARHVFEPRVKNAISRRD